MSEDAQLALPDSTHGPDAEPQDVEFEAAWSLASSVAPQPGAPIVAVQLTGRARTKGNAAGRVVMAGDGRQFASVFERRGLNRPWRTAVRNAFKQAWGKRPTIEREVVLEAVFMFKRPKAHYLGGDPTRTLKALAPKRCTSHSCGDLSKLIRCVEDEITDAKVWRDDVLVVGFGRSTKLWSDEDRALIRVVEAS